MIDIDYVERAASSQRSTILPNLTNSPIALLLSNDIFPLKAVIVTSSGKEITKDIANLKEVRSFVHHNKDANYNWYVENNDGNIEISKYKIISPLKIQAV